MLIGLVGYAGSGKDEVARMLMEGNGGRRKWVKAAFADALKADIARLVGVSVEEVEKHKQVYRPMLVAWGKWARENLHPDWWIKKMTRESRGWNEWATSPLVSLLVSDVRYVNEAKWVRYCGGVVVMVNRPNCLPANDEEARSIGLLIQASMVDRCLDNSGTLEFLRKQVEALT